jgi:hypothetical protein
MRNYRGPQGSRLVTAWLTEGQQKIRLGRSSSLFVA